ncbi:hypothetical protein DPMN_153561 [Dreissena polymorpha]|uniref:Uncharacterized protein n=1 Tax=Dreissena polymorpha TaxID=45954 RepID=A0A9D4FQ59_DREPO|nr:hypothetical protein DPMN_153561 [Dreissena polymorpha]
MGEYPEEHQLPGMVTTNQKSHAAGNGHRTRSPIRKTSVPTSSVAGQLMRPRNLALLYIEQSFF